MKTLAVSILVLCLCILPACKGKQQQTQQQQAPAESTGMRSDTTTHTDTTAMPDTMKMPDTTGRTDPPSGNGKSDPPDTSKAKTETKSDTSHAKTTWISPDKGIGPIKDLKLGPIDTTMASNGQKIFQTQCTVCHMLDQKKIGPPLRTVANDRPPEFIMNMILNTDEMEKKDPEVKKLIKEYGTLMSVLDISKDQARSLLEYLRLAATQPPSKQ